jgi:hypothetical protein
VVLNLAIEYVPSVISEGFTLSLLTGVLLKVTLELVIRVKNTILDRLRVATTRRTKVVAALSLWVVAAGSKLVVLELVDLVFGDSVSLGGFIPVTLLVFALLMSRPSAASSTTLRLPAETRPDLPLWGTTNRPTIGVRALANTIRIRWPGQDNPPQAAVLAVSPVAATIRRIARAACPGVCRATFSPGTSRIWRAGCEVRCHPLQSGHS